MLLLIKQLLKITASLMVSGGKEIPNNLLKEERRMGFIRIMSGFKMRVILGTAPEEWAGSTLKMQPGANLLVMS